MILPVQADTNGSFVYEVCRPSSKESARQSGLNVTAHYYEFFCDVLCVDFGHSYSRHFHHKKEVSSLISCCISWPCLAFLTFPTLSIERWLEQL